MYRKLHLLCFFLFIFSSYVFSQELKIDKAILLESDNEAITNPQTDNNNQLCALLKIYVDNLPGVTFNSSFIINKSKIQYNGNFYAVYVVGGLKKLTLQHNDYLPVTIDFTADFQLSIKGGKTYGIYISTEGLVQKKTQTVVFNMIPRTGSIIINNTAEKVDNGVLQIECKPGNYSYIAQADFYETKKGTFTVTDITGSKVIPLKLKARTAQVEFICNVPTAKLYIDNSLKGTPGSKKIPLGKHKARVVAEDWKDHIQDLILNKEGTYELKVNLIAKEFIPIVILASGSKKPSLYIDNKEVPEWRNNGLPIKVKQGKHLITIEDEKTEKETITKEKIVRIDQNTQKIELIF